LEAWNHRPLFSYLARFEFAGLNPPCFSLKQLCAAS
jgi:hypothetical protein